MEALFATVWRRPRGVARERQMGSESVQNLRTVKPWALYIAIELQVAA